VGSGGRRRLGGCGAGKPYEARREAQRRLREAEAASRGGGLRDESLKQQVQQNGPLLAHTFPSISPWNIRRLTLGDYKRHLYFAEQNQGG
jgi:hypothetical protein